MNQFFQWPASATQVRSQESYHFFGNTNDVQQSSVEQQNQSGYVQPGFYRNDRNLVDVSAQQNPSFFQGTESGQMYSRFCHQQPLEQQQLRDFGQLPQTVLQTNMNEKPQIDAFMSSGQQSNQTRQMYQNFNSQPATRMPLQDREQRSYLADVRNPYSPLSKETQRQEYPIMDRPVLNHPAMNPPMGTFSQTSIPQDAVNPNQYGTLSSQYIGERRADQHTPYSVFQSINPAVVPKAEPARYSIPSTVDTRVLSQQNIQNQIGQTQEFSQIPQHQPNCYPARHQSSWQNDKPLPDHVLRMVNRGQTGHPSQSFPHDLNSPFLSSSGTLNTGLQGSPVYSTSNNGPYVPSDIQVTRHPEQRTNKGEESMNQVGTGHSPLLFSRTPPPHFQAPPTNQQQGFQEQLRPVTPAGASYQANTNVNDSRYQTVTSFRSAPSVLTSSGRPPLVNPARDTNVFYVQPPLRQFNPNHTSLVNQRMPSSSTPAMQANYNFQDSPTVQRFKSPSENNPIYPPLQRQPSTGHYPASDANPNALQRNPDIVNKLNSLNIQNSSGYENRPFAQTLPVMETSASSERRIVDQPEIYGRPPRIQSSQVNDSFNGTAGSGHQHPGNFKPPYPEQRAHYPNVERSVWNQPQSQIQNRPNIHLGGFVSNANGPINRVGNEGFSPVQNSQMWHSGMYPAPSNPRPPVYAANASETHIRAPPPRHLDMMARQLSHDTGFIQQQPGATGQPIVIMPGYSSTVSNNRAPSVKFEPRIEAILEHISSKEGPLYDKLKKVVAEIFNIQDEVFSFRGRRGDQSYILIEEMLTRQLLVLDGVDSQGNEDVRLTRKSIVRQVQGLISTLESKART
ncbi:uncharacterized protein LOC135689748 [Rhopilema esculentum]|uniref:uncharacterized protein LOC135689748 n=1 Tax=Rhopilema esculentum TaxID=499914 RepID=UPI0031DA92B8|eukprot:gene8050-13964_t